jgi:hypothetical protein
VFFWRDLDSRRCARNTATNHLYPMILRFSREILLGTRFCCGRVTSEV